ncbi:hypothetical protein M6I34_16360 [Burkholderiaceae bacterium FT117]|uniref:hypothetical protein n=1 Tax=Zeimonas sediminis TaxID=2944268 RepID=UPI00234323C7|nr:hypothetical protein [Zeimonas sediminis]MCM5572091.1 hypothetical protein [Zeimonas sediminis]
MSPVLIAWVRSFFDIYSTSTRSRLGVLATMALGVVLLGLGAETGSGGGAIPFLLLVWANHERFLKTLEDLLERNRWAVVGVPLLVLAAKLVMTPPAASDDLLRHLASAFWADGYAGMYVHTALPPAPLYPAFDRVVGALAFAVGLPGAMWILQALAFSGFALVFVLAARRFLGGHPFSDVLVLVAMVLVMQTMSARLVLARPEIFLTIWALAGTLVATRLGVLIWSVTGVFLGTGYWLAALYFPAAILLPLSWRGRVGILVTMSALWAWLWWLITDGHALETVLWAFSQVANRLPGIVVGENVSIVNVLLAPSMLVLAFASFWALGRSAAEPRVFVLALFFLLSNQARYCGIVAPLFALHALSALRTAELRLPVAIRSMAITLGALSMSVLSSTYTNYATMVRFDLPPGSVVMTAFNQATYSTLFANPGEIRIAPAFEVGALKPRYQQVVLDLGGGKLHCDSLEGSGFTHLIENSLVGPIPACLTLVETQRDWRLWAVR